MDEEEREREKEAALARRRKQAQLALDAAKRQDDAAPRQKAFVMDDAPKTIKHIQFGVMSQAEIVALSEFEATRNELYQVSDDHLPQADGVLDRRLGTTAKEARCETCGEKAVDCSGHMAYIRLVLPVFHVGYFKQTITILQDVCKGCARVLLTEQERRALLPRFRRPHLENMARQKLAKEVNTLCRKAIRCPHCDYVNGSIKKSGPLRIEHDRFRAKKTHEEKAAWVKTFGTAQSDNRDIANLVSKAKEDLNALRVITLFKRISNADCELLGLSPEVCRPEEFVWTYIPIPPVAIRPSVAQDNATNEDDLTVKLAEIVKLNTLIRASLDVGEPTTKIMEIWDFLQLTVAMYINSELPGLPASTGRPIRAFCQRLKGKQGRFRGNLSGKRVDFSGRTVISPDPNLRIDEVAVPDRVAKILTYPERVTQHSYERLQQAIRNGAERHPGANYWRAAQRPGQQPNARALRNMKAPALAKLADDLKIGDVVERHLIDGDVVLFNRQPSLHKLSIMSHHVKVRPWRTFRFNECVCTPYNADFDGDEMNLHVPQTEEARIEASQLMNTKQNLVTPRNGEPIIAATQDFITGAYLLSQKDQFLDRKQFCQILSFLDDAKTHFDLPPPTIHKPQQLWTGKQVFNLLMRPNYDSRVSVNLETKCRTNKGLAKELADYDAPDLSSNDGYLVIRNSEIMCGVMDKSTVGDGKKESVFGVILRDFGEAEAAAAMNRLAKLCARWLANCGFSIGIGDVMPGVSLRQRKDDLVEGAYSDADELIRKAQTGRLQNDPGCTADETLEAQILGGLSRVRELVGDICLSELSSHNAPLIMANCGSKGSKINVSQMVACVGQQAISGQRVPDGFVDRSLPHFRKLSKRPEAKGFVRNSFFSGLTATEFLFHAVSGREGLVDTAVKTAETGYMQRRLMKALEDLSIRYDTSVRNSTGGMVQFRYGDDGLDPAQLEADSMPVNLARTWMHAKALYLLADEKGLLPYDIAKTVKAATKQDAFFLVSDQFKEALIQFCEETIGRKLADCREFYGLGRCTTIEEAEAYTDEGDEEKQKAIKAVKNKMEVKPSQLAGFLKICCLKFIKAMIQPGTAVGAVGAQSIGEPGTQMTLKTFHFAGVASMNITLGVPRIREIINASKAIATPICTVQLAKPDNEDAARIVKARIEKTYLRDVAEIIAPTYRGDAAYVAVHVNRKVARSLGLHDLTVNDIKDAIKANSKLKVENITVLPKQQRLRVYAVTDDTALKKGNKPHDDYTRLLELARKLPDTVIRGIKECARAVIKKMEPKDAREVAKRRGLPYEDEKGTRLTDAHGEQIHLLQMLVEGNGFRDVMTCDGVDGLHTVSNHLMEVEKVLGIEAARQTIINQIGFTMGTHGLTVDPRHQMLLGDLMCFKGEVLGINRFGVAKLKDSVLMLASFEKTTDHLFEGAYYAKRDAIHGISERIIMGQSASHLGTSLASLTTKRPHIGPQRKFLLAT